MRRIDASIHLIRRDVYESRNLVFARCFEQRKRTVEVSLNDRGGGVNASIHVRFRSEVDHRIWRLTGENGFYLFRIADIGMNESICGIRADFSQVIEVPGIGQLVQINDPFGPALTYGHSHERRSDETGSARDENLHLCCNSQLYAIAVSLYGTRPSSFGS